ncbi:MAG: hypothetical protein V4547_18160 [Bacteroidota bacterium]
MEKAHQSQVKKEAVTFLGLVLCMAIAVGYKTVTDNRTVTKQNTCQSVEEYLKDLPFKDLQDLMQFHVSMEQYEDAAKLRDIMRNKYGRS